MECGGPCLLLLSQPGVIARCTVNTCDGPGHGPGQSGLRCLQGVGGGLGWGGLRHPQVGLGPQQHGVLGLHLYRAGADRAIRLEVVQCIVAARNIILINHIIYLLQLSILILEVLRLTTHYTRGLPKYPKAILRFSQINFALQSLDVKLNVLRLN